MYGYVYIRQTIFRETHNVVKIGITKNLADRETTYLTGEYIRGKYIKAYEVHLAELHNIDDCLKILLDGYNQRDASEGGIEFYRSEVLDIIEDAMKSLDQYYRELTEEELKEIRRISRITLENRLQKRRELVRQQIQPREYQKTIITKTLRYFENANKGMLVLMCGIGKTLISLWIAQGLKCSKILVGVPNKLLLEQWKKEVSKIFPNIPKLCIKDGIKQNAIESFFKDNKQLIIITTYHSSYKLENRKFDIKILDETHHLTTENIDTAQERNSFIRILNVESTKQLGLTATMKELEDFENAVSNDNTAIFGNIIDEKNLLWSIDNNITTDYLIQTVQVRKEVISSIANIRNNTETNLLLAAYTAVESIKKNNSNHMLIYCNTTENAIKVIEYVKQLNSQIESSAYHSGMTTLEQTETLKKFKDAKKGIISCVYCLGEGWDFPQLDATLFAEKMTSNIRIVQSALRACRKNKDKPDKIAKLILPVLYKDNWLDDSSNDDLRKVREVIYQMSMEDERIMQKITFSEINSRDSDESSIGSLGEVNQEITQLLILKTVHRSQLGITYEKAKQIIRDEKAKMQIESQKDYLELCKLNTKLNEEPQNHFGERFISWVDYLSIEEKYYDLETAKQKIQQYLEKHFDATFGYMELAKKICLSDKKFPPVDLWSSYYKIHSINAMFNKKNNTFFDFL